MKLIRCFITFIISFVLIVPLPMNVFAYSEVTSNVTVDGRNVIIEGKISGINVIGDVPVFTTF